jgi:hypothetical protein
MFNLPTEHANLLQLTRAEIVESLLWLDGKKISLADFPMHKAIYNGGYKTTIFKTCRQVAKTTTLGCLIISDSIATPFFKTLAITPSQEQTFKFSNLRVGKMLDYSPIINKYWVADSRVLSRTYKNGSENAFSYALDDPDRLRSISADRFLADEVQDILLDVVVPVARECMSYSDYQYEFYSGTPKTLDNGIQGLWEKSTQTEWCIKCTHCKAYTFIDNERAFSPKGPICLKCKELINPREGVWIDLVPEAEMKGFHISQAIMPRNVPLCWNSGTPQHEKAVERWANVHGKLLGPRAYALATFRNEVVGVSDSVGVRLITKEILKEMCTGPDHMPVRPDLAYMKGIIKVVAGIDWSGGGKDMISNTALWIWGQQQNKKMRCLFYEVLTGQHPLVDLERVKQVLSFYQPEIVCCDAGEGNLHTDELRRIMGWHHKIHKIRYGSAAAAISWSKEAQEFNVNRTKAIDSMMMWLLRREAIFCKNQAVMEVAFDHVVAEFIEVTRLGYKIWRHSPSAPDDVLHAMVFGRLAMQMAIGEIDLTA